MGPRRALGRTPDPALLTVGIVFACCVPLTALLARTPLAVPLTGRKRVPYPRWVITPPFWMRLLNYPNGSGLGQTAEQ